MIESEVHYCVRCGAAVQRQPRFGRVRPVCPRCGWVFFPDPKVAVTVLILQDGHVLLVQRGNEPRQGCWTLPGGFMDAGEDPLHAAERECLEETGLYVRVTHLLQVIHPKREVPGADLVLYYRAEPYSGEIQAGDDAAQVRFFSLTDLPELAFLTHAGLTDLVQAAGQPV